LTFDKKNISDGFVVDMIIIPFVIPLLQSIVTTTGLFITREVTMANYTILKMPLQDIIRKNIQIQDLNLTWINSYLVTEFN
jgi:hypothetical protein